MIVKEPLREQFEEVLGEGEFGMQVPLKSQCLENEQKVSFPVRHEHLLNVAHVFKDRLYSIEQDQEGRVKGTA